MEPGCCEAACTLILCDCTSAVKVCVAPRPSPAHTGGHQEILGMISEYLTFLLQLGGFFFTPEMLSRICKFGKSGHLRGKEHILGEQSTKYEMWGHMSFLCFSHCVAGGKHM